MMVMGIEWTATADYERPSSFDTKVYETKKRICSGIIAIRQGNSAKA
jgi:hypothetical protein